MRHRATTYDKENPQKGRHQLGHLFLGFFPVRGLRLEHGSHGGCFVTFCNR